MFVLDGKKTHLTIFIQKYSLFITGNIFKTLSFPKRRCVYDRFHVMLHVL